MSICKEKLQNPKGSKTLIALLTQGKLSSETVCEGAIVNFMTKLQHNG